MTFDPRASISVSMIMKEGVIMNIFKWILIFVSLLKTHCEEDKVFLVVFSDTVIHPGAVMVHLLDAAFTHTVETK